jgi:hypothetical protein
MRNSVAVVACLFAAGLGIAQEQSSLKDVAWGPFTRHEHYRNLVFDCEVKYRDRDDQEDHIAIVRLAYGDSKAGVPPPYAVEELVENTEPHLKGALITKQMDSWDRVKPKVFTRHFVSQPPHAVRLSDGRSGVGMRMPSKFLDEFGPLNPCESMPWDFYGDEVARYARWNRKLGEREDRFGRTAYWIHFDFPQPDGLNRKSLVTVPPDSLVLETTVTNASDVLIVKLKVSECVEHNGILFPKSLVHIDPGIWHPLMKRHSEWKLNSIRPITEVEREWYWGSAWPNGTKVYIASPKEHKVIPYSDEEMAILKRHVADHLPFAARAQVNYWWFWYVVNAIAVLILIIVIVRHVRGAKSK